MGLYPLNVDKEVPVQPSGGGGAVDGARLMRSVEYEVAPRNTDTDGIVAAVTLLAAAQPGQIPTVLNADKLLACPQLVTVKGAMVGATSLTGDVKIYGTDIAGDAITDTIALNDAASVDGVKAFATVTKVDYPARVTAGDTVEIGFTKAVGLPWKLPRVTRLLEKTLDGSADTGTVTYDATDLAKNIYVPSGTPNGTKKLNLVAVV